MSRENVAIAKRIYDGGQSGEYMVGGLIGFRHEPEEFIDAGGDTVVALLHTYARGRESGADVEVPVAHVLTFKQGKCMGYVSYHDRAKALRLAGVKR